MGEFDVTDRPGPSSRYDCDLDYRVDAVTGAPVCVHPYRVGLPPGAYCSAGVPVPTVPDVPPAPTRDALDLPDDDVTNLEAWIIAVLRAAGRHAFTRHSARPRRSQVSASRRLRW